MTVVIFGRRVVVELVNIVTHLLRANILVVDCTTTMLRHCCVSLSGRRKCHFFSTAKDQAWERSAKLVKDTESTKHQPYMQTIRATHDPAMHVKTLEEELMGTMGAALGKQAEKIEHFLNLMSAELVKYNELRQETNPCLAKLKDTALRHNEFREDAKRARWELLVHRQAVGFIVNNHNVGECFMIIYLGSCTAYVEYCFRCAHRGVLKTLSA